MYFFAKSVFFCNGAEKDSKEAQRAQRNADEKYVQETKNVQDDNIPNA